MHQGHYVRVLDTGDVVETAPHSAHCLQHWGVHCVTVTTTVMKWVTVVMALTQLAPYVSLENY